MIAGVHSDTGIRGGALFVDNLPEKPYCHVEGITVTARPVIEAQTRTASNAATAASLVAAGGVSLLPDYSLRTGPSAELLRLHGWTEAFDPTIGAWIRI